MNGMPLFERGGDWLEGLQLHPDWMEWTMIMGAIALVVIAAALIALVVKVWLDRPAGPLEVAAAPAPAAPAPMPVIGAPAPTAAADAGTTAAADETPTEVLPDAGTASWLPVDTPETPRAILDRRYAAGEIDRDEYLARKADIDQ